ncbi:erythromycin esterase family protein [Streptomyces sp. NPDC047981]|uniref:erythromycin esterase family protein n=1 Tax=Streptomyces sp. NPDC047981 TaxID=3154610 RepID=UPI003431DB38
MKTITRQRLPLVGAALALCVAALAPAAAASESASASATASDPARELAHSARALTDLRPLERMIGSAKVVGIGEATHSSAEFFESKHRIFEHLVERKGFTTFALEANWSAGLRIDDYVRFGKGDPKRIMAEEFQNAYRFWNTEEYLDLIVWMRQHNLRHPDHPVRFMGNDLGYAGPELFDKVTGYVARTYPRLLPRFQELYRASRPVGSVDSWMNAYMARPLEERRRLSADVNRALALLERQKPGRDREEHAWTVQHARAIAQVGTEMAHDVASPSGVAEAMLYRDRIMAENTVWWQRRTGDRMLLSAHNGHVGYETTKPDQYPRLQGAFLRDALGRDYVSVGASFGKGSFNAHDTEAPGEPIRSFTVGLPGAGDSSAETLDRVSPRPFYLDLRTTTPAARSWLDVHRPAWLVGTAYPWEGSQAPVRLATAYDVLVHFPEVSAARLR